MGTILVKHASGGTAEIQNDAENRKNWKAKGFHPVQDEVEAAEKKTADKIKKGEDAAAKKETADKKEKPVATKKAPKKKAVKKAPKKKK